MNNLPPSVAIRNARMSDWPRLRHAVRAIFDHLDDAQVSHLLRRHHAGTVVACHGREIAGYYQFYPHVEPRVAWLNFFGMTPRWRGQGTADILLTYLSDTQRRAASNRWPSTRLKTTAQSDRE